jgi:hypothetical protein
MAMEMEQNKPNPLEELERAYQEAISAKCAELLRREATLQRSSGEANNGNGELNNQARRLSRRVADLGGG